jgi:hypothetical protein
VFVCLDDEAEAVNHLAVLEFSSFGVWIATLGTPLILGLISAAYIGIGPSASDQWS